MAGTPGADARPVRSLLVASAGGHLEELRLLASRLAGPRREATWVTWETPQSRALLDGEAHVFIEFAAAHDPLATLRTLRSAHRILEAERFDEVISTGALPAVPFMALARARGIACHYIESAARLSGPSLAGRLVRAIPGVRCYRQYPQWTRPSGWTYLGSVFDAFSPGQTRPRPIRRAVVSVGSSRYGFRRLVVAARDALPPDCEVLWQTGSTDVSGLGIEAATMVSPAVLQAAVERADVVIAHGGVGTALLALEAGRCPLLVAREEAEGEHVDDHQRLLVDHLVARRLAVTAAPDRLDAAVLEAAAARTIDKDPTAEPLALTPAPAVLARPWRRNPSRPGARRRD